MATFSWQPTACTAANRGLTLHDWGDSGAGHPLLEQTASLIGPEQRRGMHQTALGTTVARGGAWAQIQLAHGPFGMWTSGTPGVSPALYRLPSSRAEHTYNRGDPAERAGRTAMLVRARRTVRTKRESPYRVVRPELVALLLNSAHTSTESKSQGGTRPMAPTAKGRSE